MVQVTTYLSHDVSSTGPAFLVRIKEVVPEILEVALPYYLEIDGTITLLYNYSSTHGSSTVLDVRTEIIPVHTEVILTYFALFSPDHQIDGTFIASTVVNYSTIRQEGIGLLVRSAIKSMGFYFLNQSYQPDIKLRPGIYSRTCPGVQAFIFN